ncbi:MAG: hypothetical protein K2X48_17120 [Chitinophagaceae bacterium]|nr:hypothetical protein [Chitinophagaceae bacterium]
MKQIHVECLPDEALVMKLGFARKMITHHSGKSRVFNKLEKSKNVLALADEDPGSAKTTYEKKLKLRNDSNSITYYEDASGNKIFVLKVKLENWIIEQCKISNVSPQDYGFTAKPNEFHDVINQRLERFRELLGALIDKNNPGIIQLKSFLSS